MLGGPTAAEVAEARRLAEEEAERVRQAEIEAKVLQVRKAAEGRRCRSGRAVPPAQPCRQCEGRRYQEGLDQYEPASIWRCRDSSLVSDVWWTLR